MAHQPPAKRNKDGPESKRRKIDQEDPLTRGLLGAVWRNRPGEACVYVDDIKATGATPGPEACAAFLRVCGWGDDWESAARRDNKTPSIIPLLPRCSQEPPGFLPVKADVQDPSPAEMLVKGEAMIAALQHANSPMTEAIYLAMARIACIKGEPQSALAYARAARQLYEQQQGQQQLCEQQQQQQGQQEEGQGEGQQQSQPPQQQGAGQQKLLPRVRRLYHPALVACAVVGDHVTAAAVEKELREVRLELTECEMVLLLEAEIGSGRTDPMSLLLELPWETRLRDCSLNVIERLFTAPQQDGMQWNVITKAAAPNADGYLAAAGAKVPCMEPDAEDYGSFAAALGILAAAKESTRGAFHSFQQWLRNRAAYQLLVDGMIVAYWGQGTKKPVFHVQQLAHMLDALRQQRPNDRILLVLPVSKQAAWEQGRGRTLATDTYYVTGGSCDDWYWLYATVMAGSNGTAMTDDRMRNYQQDLHHPPYFPLWQQHHVMTYAFDASRRHAILHSPPVYTTRIQQLQGGAWVMPALDGTWAVARPMR